MFDINIRQLRLIIKNQKLNRRRRISLKGLPLDATEIKRLEAYNGLNLNLIVQCVILSLVATLPSLTLLFMPAKLAFLVFFSASFVILGIVYFTRCSALILNAQDVALLLSKPVNSATLLALRIFEIAKEIGALLFAFSLPAIGVCLYQYGVLASTRLALALVLMVFLLAFVHQIIFVIALQSQKRRNSEMWALYCIVACIAALVIVASSMDEVIVHWIGGLDAQQMAELTLSPWALFLPPVWYTALTLQDVTVVSGGSSVLYAMAAGIPIVGLCLSTVLLSKKILPLLLGLGKPTQIDQAVRQRRISAWLERTLNTSSIERGFFRFCLRNMQNDAHFKLSTYPQLGMILAFLASYFHGNWDESLASQQHTFSYYLFLYFITGFMVNVYSAVLYGNAKAADVFKTMPLTRDGRISLACCKVYYLRMLMPLQLSLCVAGVFLWGLPILIDTGIAVMASLSILLSQAYRLRRCFPFSQDPEVDNSGVRILVDQLVFLVPLVMCMGLHFFARQYFTAYALLIVAAFYMLAFAGLYYLLNKYRENATSSQPSQQWQTQ